MGAGAVEAGTCQRYSLHLGPGRRQHQFERWCGDGNGLNNNGGVGSSRILQSSPIYILKRIEQTPFTSAGFYMSEAITGPQNCGEVWPAIFV